MSRAALQAGDATAVEALLSRVAKGIPHRHPELFFGFLRRGYDLVRLSHADPRHQEAAFIAKLALGSIITAIDDLADDPARVDLRALERASALVLSPAGPFAPESELETLLLVLRDEMVRRLQTLPGFTALGRVFAFDLTQIVQANAFHQLLTSLPSLGNATEMRQFGPYNMGMVAAHMIDLMTRRDYPMARLGQDREVFHWGQRHGRISNMLSTYSREAKVGDVTSELLHPAGGATTRALQEERREILRRIQSRDGTSFRVGSYAAGLAALQRLHEESADSI